MMWVSTCTLWRTPLLNIRSKHSCYGRFTGGLQRRLLPICGVLSYRAKETLDRRLDKYLPRRRVADMPNSVFKQMLRCLMFQALLPGVDSLRAMGGLRQEDGQPLD